MYLADHPFLNVLWSMFLLFVWFAWFWLLISIAIDVFRRRDIGGGMKAVWIVVIIFLPLIGTLIYLITQGNSMAERGAQAARDQQQAADSYIRSVSTSGGAAGEIKHAKDLLDSGAITQAEFEQLKSKALAAG